MESITTWANSKPGHLKRLVGWPPSGAAGQIVAVRHLGVAVGGRLAEVMEAHRAGGDRAVELPAEVVRVETPEAEELGKRFPISPDLHQPGLRDLGARSHPSCDVALRQSGRRKWRRDKLGHTF